MSALRAPAKVPRFTSPRTGKFTAAGRALYPHAVKRPAKGKESNFAIGERIFHQKFGYGKITDANGTKLTVEFEKAGTKMVLDSFVERP